MVFLKQPVFYLLLFYVFAGSCQKKQSTDLVTVNNLSALNMEISGITLLPGKKVIYAINDSGNDNTIFELDYKGTIKGETRVSNTKNIDWEDLAYDHHGHIYIGDFGNNNNDRKDLVIYKISNLSSPTPSSSKISFVLEDQKGFPPKKKNKNFDIEAMIYLHGNLFLFTKNRSSEFNGYTKLYKIPAQAGNHTAQLVSSYKTCEDEKDCFITGAAVNESGTKIALLTYNKLFVLTDYTDDQLFSGTINKIKLNHYSQKEGICFKDDHTIFITDEGRKISPATLYEYTLH